MKEIKIRYKLTTDDDGHWYVIPVNKSDEWEKWLDSTDVEDGIVPDWAEEVGGCPSSVSFTEYTIS